MANEKTDDRRLTCWFMCGDLYVVVKEDPEMQEGLRTMSLRSGELGPNVYDDREQLIDGEGLDPDEMFGVIFERSKFGGVEVTGYPTVNEGTTL